MGKYTGILLCSDFDGTMYNGREIPEDNIKAIKYFRENGGLFTVASGRNSGFVLPFFEGYEFGVPIININGAVLYDADKKCFVRESFMTELSWDKLLRIICEIEGLFCVSFFKRAELIRVYIDKGEKVSSELLKDVYKVTFGIEGDRDVSNRAVYEISRIVGDRYCVLRSSWNYIEVIDREFTKQRATREVSDMVRADILVCVGDFENDIDMVRGADIGYAVANAIDELKAVADRQTVSVNDGAIARIIEEL